MVSRVNLAGLVVAATGFFLTRVTVTLALYNDPRRFYLAGVVPLVLGLGLAAFGVALTVADVDRSLVRTTAVWCVGGTVAMLVLVVLTLLGSTGGDVPAFETVRSRAYLSNFLIGGSVGGTMTGLYAARNRHQRDRVRQHATRLEVLNRLLRHEILNGLTAIRGFASVEGAGSRDPRRVIADRSDDIAETIEEVRYLTESAGPTDPVVGAVPVRPQVADSVRSVADRHPDATVSVDHASGDPAALANDRLGYVFAHLVENAVVHGGEDATVEVATSATADHVAVTVSDDGPGLPERERRLLERGEVPDRDAPGAGFGLYFVRFLVEGYGGSVETDVSADGTDVTVVLPRARPERAGFGPTPGSSTGVRPAGPHLAVVVGAALVAGVVFGITAELLGGSVGVIGVLYGVQSPVVGWITHQFHSVVFGFVFAGLVALAPPRYRDHVPAYVAIGTAWALALWLLAAGVVSPVWLRLLGFSAPIPNLSPTNLVAHLTWGTTLGALAALGYRHVAPSLAGDRRTGD